MISCKHCTLKHLALALSYGKEFLDGNEDHFVDCLGQIINAEYHLLAINSEYAKRVKEFRTKLQQMNSIQLDDIDRIRSFYTLVQMENESITELPIIFIKNPTPLCSEYLKNLSDYSEIITEGSLLELLESTSKPVVVLSGKIIVLRPFKATLFPRGCFSQVVNKVVSESLETTQKPIWDFDKNFGVVDKRLLTVEAPRELLENYPLTVFNYFIQKTEVPQEALVGVVDKQICCQLRQKLETGFFARVEAESFFIDYLNEKKNL